MVMYTIIPDLQRFQQEDQEFEASVDHVTNFGPSWDIVSKQKQTWTERKRKLMLCHSVPWSIHTDMLSGTYP